jgi:hypothetical protein
VPSGPSLDSTPHYAKFKKKNLRLLTNELEVDGHVAKIGYVTTF